MTAQDSVQNDGRSEAPDAVAALEAAGPVASAGSDRDAWPRRQVVSFGRRDGRRQGQYARAYLPELARFVIEPPRGERSASLADGWVFDASAAFERDAPLVVEIGSGTGEAVLHHAAENPHLNHLAVEVYRPGASRTVAQAGVRGLQNVRVLEADAAELVGGALAPGSVAALHVFFPDPWPKARHHKRRLVDAWFVAQVARALEPGGVLRMATDWEHYAHQMLQVAAGCGHLRNAYPARDGGWAPRYSGRPLTTFERKGLAAGRTIHDVEFVRA